MFFHLCLQAEEVPARLETYRDRLICLQKLSFSAAFYDTVPEYCQEGALLYLSGMLCVNFSPLWDPVIEIITSFAQRSNVKLFWKVFNELLNTAAKKTGYKSIGASFLSNTVSLTGNSQQNHQSVVIFRRKNDPESRNWLVFFKNSGTSPYGHLSNADTSLLRTDHLVPERPKYI